MSNIRCSGSGGGRFEVVVQVEGPCALVQRVDQQRAHPAELGRCYGCGRSHHAGGCCPGCGPARDDPRPVARAGRPGSAQATHGQHAGWPQAIEHCRWPTRSTPVRNFRRRQKLGVPPGPSPPGPAHRHTGWSRGGARRSARTVRRRLVAGQHRDHSVGVSGNLGQRLLHARDLEAARVEGTLVARAQGRERIPDDLR